MAAGRLSTDQKFRIGLGVIITAAWAVSFLVDIQVERYDPPAYIGPLMLIVAGSVFGEGLVRSAVRQITESNGNGNGKKSEPQPDRKETKNP